MPQIDEARHRSLQEQVLPELIKVRRKWRKGQWWILSAVVGVEAAGLAAIQYYMGEKKPTFMDAIVSPALFPVLQKIWTFDGTLRRFDLAIKSGDRDAIVEAIDSLSFLIHFGNLQQVVDDVEQSL